MLKMIENKLAVSYEFDFLHMVWHTYSKDIYMIETIRMGVVRHTIK